MSYPSLLVFGPQTNRPSAEYLSQLRTILLLDPRLQVLVGTIKGLPDLWNVLLREDPRLESISGLASANALERWIDGQIAPSAQGEQVNAFSLPLTIITHLIQYMYYLDNDASYPSQARILESTKHGGMQGFCAGILTAVAVACSNNDEGINQFGAIAVRLAFCIGAYVDLDSALNVETVTLAVRWRSSTGHDRVREIVRGHSSAYISVVLDENNVSVTVNKPSLSALSQALSEEGMSVLPIGLEGRFHSPSNNDSVQRILALCKSQPDLSFPDAQHLRVPVRSNATSQVIQGGSLNQHVLQCILLEVPDWQRTMKAAAAKMALSDNNLVAAFGTTKSVSQPIANKLGLTVVDAKSWNLSPRKESAGRSLSSHDTGVIPTNGKSAHYGENAIAVVGMACKFPGADSIEEFWELLCEGTSMLDQMPADRFSTEGLRRTPDGKFRFFGNFVRDIAAFDHRFFKKSSREAASMDPQQRLMLQCAYEAMESAGHFGKFSSPVADDIGCFVGVCTNDYNDNVASHDPNAYSSVGTLRAFIAGKLSHYFGWTGPSLTFDTACSSSAVAIHDACRSLQLNECSQAVAGGINLFTTPYFYENLVSASFLSPTGQTKPFDANADGYCRGEGAGLVVLKKLSAAIADGDTVMGVIAASGINQNSNTVGITVPHSPSQAALYTKAMKLAGADPKSVTYVEAHGTGTPVGDPREISSIREVFGGHDRTSPLYVSSVKGNIGHLEAASGIASLIKTLLMIKYNAIPVQASFQSLNPAIPALEPDQLIIPKSTQKWDASFKLACINNYGASGSNATMVLCEPPAKLSHRHIPVEDSASLPKYPFFVSGHSHASLAANCAALQSQISRSSADMDSQVLLASMAFNLAIKQNRALSHVFATTAATLSEASDNLSTACDESNKQIVQVAAKEKPLVLVFGGQVNDAVGLSRDLYDSSVLFHSYLDQCDIILRSFGLTGLYPEIFQTTAVSDIVSLQSMVFSLQYSCSKAWMDSGLKVEAVVGHSLGQFAAMCISGTITLEEGLKLVSGRASLMQKNWGAERGSMLAIETDITSLQDILSEVNMGGADHNVEIACYNGPTSHVLVGGEASITKVREVIARRPESATPVKSKRLNVTHGFHSVFTEPLLPSLRTLAGEIAFKEPTIPIETCSDGQSWGLPNAHLVAEHTRSPVYFGQAIRRVTERLGPCTWLEAGSATSVIGMARRALDTTEINQHSFQAAQLSSVGAVESLVDTTVNLWKWGHQVQFWPFHHCQKHQYMSIDLPPYQFEKTTHWLDWREPSGSVVETKAPPVILSQHELITLTAYKGKAQQVAEFTVNPRCKQWIAHVTGHAVLDQPLCPAPMYVELATRAGLLLQEDKSIGLRIPLIEDIEIKAPLGLAQDRHVSMIVTQAERPEYCWTFEVSSQPEDGTSPSVSHATGRITFQPQDSQLLADFARYKKLISIDRVEGLKFNPESEALQGAMVYKMFSKVVNYGDFYKGVRAVFSHGEEAYGKVIPPNQSEDGLAGMITSPLALDSFIQVSGLHVNSLSECGPGQVFVCTKLERIQISPSFKADNPQSRSWNVFTNFTRPGSKTVSNDIYVFDGATQELVMIILGAFFTRVSIASLGKVLSQANTKSGETGALSNSKSTGDAAKKSVTVSAISQPTHKPAKPKKLAASRGSSALATSSRTSVEVDLRNLINRVTDVPVGDLKDEASLEDLGIDSLMINEVATEVAKFFAVNIDPHNFEHLPNIKSLCDFIIDLRPAGPDDAGDIESDDEPSSSSSHSDDDFTATPNTEYTEASEDTILDDTVQRLAKLLASHLEISQNIDRQANLAALGLDSLMCMELATDIKDDIGVALDMHLVTDDSTFGDLCDMVSVQQRPAKSKTPAPPVNSVPQHRTVPMETVVYKTADNLSLNADIYYPPEVTPSERPIALLIHGGGHCLYTRKDVNSKQIKKLLARGFLPVSVDYRFCPELTLLDGPMTDVRDALQWARNTLPFLDLNCPGLKIDGKTVVAVGWSTGGTLAMSLGFTPQRYGIRPPEAILAFYCPSNYDDDCFKNPIYPRDSISSPNDEYDLIDSVRDDPLVAYYPPLNKGAQGSFLMGLADERWRIILHMNWKAQMVPILVNGLPSKNKLAGRDPESYKSLPMPSSEQIALISPYAQISQGNYRTPTFIMHGTDDDLVPCQQSQKTVELLKRKGVECGIANPRGAKHLFDTFASEDPTGTGSAAIEEGYAFLFRQVGL